jgi:protein-tyrosine phosphatase
MDKIEIVFVCLGNYCRSPMAEAIFNALAQADGHTKDFLVSSAGTKNWDISLRPDPRAQAILEENQYPLSAEKRARIITQDEIHNADYVIAMTKSIADELGNGGNVHLLLDFSTGVHSKDIPDPYPTNTFSQAFNMIEDGVKSFYSYLKQTYFE